MEPNVDDKNGFYRSRKQRLRRDARKRINRRLNEDRHHKEQKTVDRESFEACDICSRVYRIKWCKDHKPGRQSPRTLPCGHKKVFVEGEQVLDVEEINVAELRRILRDSPFDKRVMDLFRKSTVPAIATTSATGALMGVYYTFKALAQEIQMEWSEIEDLLDADELLYELRGFECAPIVAGHALRLNARRLKIFQLPFNWRAILARDEIAHQAQAFIEEFNELPARHRAKYEQDFRKSIFQSVAHLDGCLFSEEQATELLQHLKGYFIAAYVPSIDEAFSYVGVEKTSE